jgi:hypothetical protein
MKERKNGNDSAFVSNTLENSKRFYEDTMTNSNPVRLDPALSFSILF